MDKELEKAINMALYQHHLNSILSYQGFYTRNEFEDKTIDIVKEIYIAIIKFVSKKTETA